MEEKENSTIESLLEKSEEYGKTTIELIKLKALDKTAEITSSLLLKGAFIIILSVFFIMVTIGVALLLGELFGKIWYGFFAVGGLYGVIGFILYFLMHKWFKRVVGNFIIRQALKED
jgi:hypothetical protein